MLLLRLVRRRGREGRLPRRVLLRVCGRLRGKGAGVGVEDGTEYAGLRSRSSCIFRMHLNRWIYSLDWGYGIDVLLFSHNIRAVPLLRACCAAPSASTG